MADLTISQLQEKLPVNCLTITNGVASLNLSLLTGDNDFQGTTGISEFVHKLLLACENAQSTYNTNKPANDPVIAGYPELFAASPTPVNSILTAAISHTVNVLIPLDSSSISSAIE